MPIRSARGIAMISALMVLMLMSALLVGFTSVVVSDQRYRFIDRDRSQAFYGASGGLEKLTADLGNTFFANVAPTASQISTLAGNSPSITGVSYTASAAPTPLPASLLSVYGGKCDPSGTPARHTVTAGSNGYTVTFCTDATGNPVAVDQSPIKSGPYEGLIALQTPYQLDVTAKTTSAGEVHLSRTIESVAIPVFQFGVFSDVDLAFFAGPNFDFGGRVHSNGNLFLSQGDSATLTLRDKVTAVREIIRQRLQNTITIGASTHNGTVSMAKAAGTFRALDPAEGSVVDGVTSAINEPTWHTVSLSTYNSWIRNGRTGAKALNLPLITVGGSNPDLIRRAPVGEDTTNPILLNERLFTKASLRILLSDTAAAITGLPTVTGTAPILLDGDWKTTAPTGYGPVDATHLPIARSPGLVNGTATTNTTANTAAGALTVSVAAVPTMFLNPATLTVNGIVAVTGCTGRTATTFIGCNVPSNVTSGQTVTATSRLGNFTASTTLTANTSSGGGKTLTVASTWSFAANSFWIGDALVTCQGPTSGTQFGACTNVPASTQPAAVTFGAASSVDTGTIGGYIKIERQNATGVWTDVTAEILNYGIGGPNLDGLICGDPTPNAILRIERLRDNGSPASCPTTSSLSSYDYWPNVLFDTREGLVRDVSPGTTTVPLGGVMHYIALDVANLSNWFRGTAPFNAGTGSNSRTDNGGFTVYFSDRRNNRTTGNLETAEYGWEDFVNPSASDGAANGVLDAGEDTNASGALDTYGSLPNYNGASGTVPPGAIAPLNGSARPSTMVTRAQAQVNRAILFRRALKLINGSAIAATGVTGLTVVAENPVYIQGDWNATGATFAGTHAATAVMADALTLLSNAWTDKISFTQPYAPGSRNRGTPTWFRVAVIAGKGMAFPQPTGTATDFGTDGGTHNFLRYLENGDQAVNYRGSMASFFYNRQALGTYKCCTTVYGAPTRNYAFDTDFLTPALLPPNTPVFRDMNAVGFSQELRPGR